MNYEEDMRIDETALDIEWLEQATLMLKYSRHAAEVRAAFDKAKEKLELTRAELDKAIRKEPELFEVEKVTDKAIESAILVQPEYKRASEEYLQLKFEYDIAAGAVKAFDARKDALENLVRLNGQQYFAGPKTPRDLSSERAGWQDKINASIGAKLRRRNIV